MEGGMMLNRLLALVLMVIAVPVSATQDKFDLDKLNEKFVRHFEKVLPGWQHKRVEPVDKDENVLIQFWSFGNRKIKVSVLPRSSTAEARDALKSFVGSDPTRESLQVGDESYAWGYGSGSVALRKGRLSIYIAAFADIDSDTDASSLSQEQRFEREKAEIRRLSREFAKHAVDAVDAQ
jgi:hypothetical protein